MATKKNREKLSTDYMIDLLDNGIVLSTPPDGFAECEKYGEDSDKYNAVCKLLGENFWDDIRSSAEAFSTPRVKVTITVEER